MSIDRDIRQLSEMLPYRSVVLSRALNSTVDKNGGQQKFLAADADSIFIGEAGS